MLQGLPDLAAPLGGAGGQGTVFAGFERPDLAVVLPHDVALGRRPDGVPSLSVTLLRSQPDVTGGWLEAEFVADADLPAVGLALSERGKSAQPLAASLTEAQWIVQASLSIGNQPLFPAVTSDPNMLLSAWVSSELTKESAVLCATLVEDGKVPVSATFRASCLAVPPRLPATVTYDPRELAERLAAHFGAAAVVEADDLAQRLRTELLAASMPGAGPAPDPKLLAQVLALHLNNVVAVPDFAEGPHYRLKPPDESPHGRVTLDLAQPTGVLLHTRLVLDPAAASSQIAEYTSRLVRRVEVPAFPTGEASVWVAANLPQPLKPALTVIGDLRFPPTEHRPQQVTASAVLDPPNTSATVKVMLAPGEDPNGSARLRVLADTKAGPVEMTGPSRPFGALGVIFAGDSLPCPVTSVRVTKGLLQDATVSVRRAGDDVTVAVFDSVESPSAGVMRLADNEPLRIVVTPRGPGRSIEMPLDNRAHIELDSATLPGFGSHTAEIIANLSADASPVTVEWRPEGSEEAPQQVRLTPTAPKTTIRWIATSPFQPGIVWRKVGDTDWSPPVRPDEPTTETPTATARTIVVDGVELTADPQNSNTWTYIPPGPTVNFDAAGKPEFSVIRAGDTAFLQLTTRVDYTDQARDALTAKLHAQVGDDALARSAQIVVKSVALQHAAGPDGPWNDIISGTSSGLPPWITALSAMLTAEQTADVDAALAGERGRLRISGEFEIPATPVTTGTASSHSSLVTVRVGGTVATTTATRTETSTPATSENVVHHNDFADMVPVPH